jgi:hypothetical protein
MKKTFTEWARELELEIQIGREPLEFFHWVLEDEYSSRLDEALEYFAGRPDFLREECIEHLVELEQLETLFVGLEEYEKCQVIRDLRIELQQRYRDFLLGWSLEKY